MRSMQDQHVLVLGDVIIDEFTYGTKIGVSAETPTVVAKFDRHERFVGGAGLVVRNLLRLGAKVMCVFPSSVSDTISKQFIGSTDGPNKAEMLRLTEISTGTALQDLFSSWKHPEKRRYFVDGYKMVQYDVLSDRVHTRSTVQVLKDRLTSILSPGVHQRLHHDPITSVIVADNRHGSINKEFAELIVDLTNNENVPLYVDSQISQSQSNHAWYNGATNMVLNEREFEELTGTIPICNSASRDFELACGDLVSHLGLTRLYIKLGPRGSVCYDPLNSCSKMRFSITDQNIQVRDTCGAGDAFLAALVVSEGNQALANRWASASVKLSGTRVPRIEELSL